MLGSWKADGQVVILIPAQKAGSCVSKMEETRIQTNAAKCQNVSGFRGVQYFCRLKIGRAKEQKDSVSGNQVPS